MVRCHRRYIDRAWSSKVVVVVMMREKGGVGWGVEPQRMEGVDSSRKHCLASLPDLYLCLFCYFSLSFIYS